MEQLLRDESVPPTDAIIADGLKGASRAYVAFLKGLEPYGMTLMGWRYYNDGKAWLNKGEYKWTTPRGASKVKPLFWLSIWEGFFKISFFFSADLTEELLRLSISDEAKASIQNAKPMGKTMRLLPVVLEINDDLHLKDVYELAQFKKNMTK